MEIKVFGPGCSKCMEADSLVRAVASAKDGEINVVKVTDYKEMMASGVMSTPAISIDGVVKCTGRVPTREEVSDWIDGAGTATTASASEDPPASKAGR